MQAVFPKKLRVTIFRIDTRKRPRLHRARGWRLPKMRPKFIYIITSELGFLKIGIAIDVEKRRRQLSTASPVKLRIYKKFSILTKMRASSIETLIHHKLRNFRANGEWFNIAPEDAVDVIEKVIAAADLIKDAAAEIKAPPAPKVIVRQQFIVCPSCRHVGKTAMSNKQIWATTFRCSGCNKSIQGRRFFIRSVA